MKYMGSKRRIAKHILPIMLKAADDRSIDTWVEPFVGGGNMIDKVPSDFTRFGFDLNPHTIAALKDIRDNPEILPDAVSEEEYRSYFGREQSKSNLVFVSEYNAPEDFIEVWRGDVKTSFSSNRTLATHNAVEKLFLASL